MPRDMVWLQTQNGPPYLLGHDLFVLMGSSRAISGIFLVQSLFTFTGTGSRVADRVRTAHLDL